MNRIGGSGPRRGVGIHELDQQQIGVAALVALPADAVDSRQADMDLGIEMGQPGRWRGATVPAA
jgi:hypothetical protein